VSAVDTSVVVAALAQWHEAHRSARREAHGRSVPAHAYLEAYAVLTRLPLPRRLDEDTAHRLLAAWFPARVLHPRAGFAPRFAARMAAAGVSGGASYDAVVALTAAEHGEELLTRDHRAEGTYRRLGIAYRLVG
jgi:predicted nucleic acid-binding protein